MEVQVHSRFFLQGITVIITGAAGGLGKDIAAAYLRSGANVAICDVHRHRLEECEQEWSQLYPGKFLAVRADVTDQEDLKGLFNATISKFNNLNVLINNAAILGDFCPAGDCTVELWDRVLAINLTGPLLTTKLAVQYFQERDPAGGIIINIGSESSSRATKSGVAYTVSKRGLDGLTMNTARFYGSRGISCMCLSLGPVVGTNIFDPLRENAHATFQDTMKRLTGDFDPAQHAVPKRIVADYCLFLSNQEIAAASNGSLIELRKNWSLN